MENHRAPEQYRDSDGAELEGKTYRNNVVVRERRSVTVAVLFRCAGLSLTVFLLLFFVLFVSSW
jgi:hypothetical protein